MKSVDSHLADVLDLVSPLGAIELSLGDAHGCVLAEDITATAPLPGFDNSQMDGYAVRSEDVAAATEETPVALPVVADLAAGPQKLGVSVQPGFSARIMTGAPLPPGADAVVPVEWTDGGTATVRVQRPAPPGLYVRRAGEDVTAGSVVLTTGTYLGAAQVGLLAACGRSSVFCHPRPRVVVVSTGSELVEVGEPLGPGMIADSNSHALAAACREAGAIAFRVGLVPDSPAQLLAALEDHLIRADLLLTSGGVSVGAYDIVRQVLGDLGTVAFERVAMQPGMPQGAGLIGPDRTPVLALPGNPVSALVSFEVFVRPALRRMLGAEPLHRPRVEALLTAPITSPAGKRQFLRARVEREPDGMLATPIGGPGSHLMAGMAAANALLVIDEDVTEMPAWSRVTAMLLERRGR